MPEPLTPVTHTNSPSGISTSTFCKLCDVAPVSCSIRVLAGLRRSAGSGIDCRPDKITAGERRFEIRHVLRRAMGDDRPAAAPRAGADVDQIVARPHQRFVVLDDDDRVALLLQVAERGDQPIVVARMQADRRLIEQVQHADQPRADAGRQSHPLPLAAAERVGRPVEREVLGADAEQELQPADDLGQNRLGDLLLVGAEFQSAEKVGRRGDGERR